MVSSQNMAILDHEVGLLLDQVSKHVDHGLAACASQEDRQGLLSSVDRALTTASAYYFDMDEELHKLKSDGEQADMATRLVHYKTELTRFQSRLVLGVIATNVPISREVDLSSGSSTLTPQSSDTRYEPTEAYNRCSPDDLETSLKTLSSALEEQCINLNKTSRRSPAIEKSYQSCISSQYYSPNESPRKIVNSSSRCKIPHSQPENAPSTPVHPIVNIGCNPDEFEYIVRSQIAAGREILEDNSRELERSDTGYERSLGESRDELRRDGRVSARKVIFLSCIFGFGALVVCGLFAATLYYKYSEIIYRYSLDI